MQLLAVVSSPDRMSSTHTPCAAPVVLLQLKYWSSPVDGCGQLQNASRMLLTPPFGSRGVDQSLAAPLVKLA
jgi:hypothetical protein